MVETKGDRTRQRIVERVAPLFNTRGYFGTSMQDVLDATGLRKGGVYGHFASKDDLALAAFDFAFARSRRRYERALTSHRHTVDRLIALIAVHGDLLDDPYLAGGCPILNTAIESDDAHPRLRERARDAADRWREMLRRTVAKGLERGEMADCDPDEVASVVMATLEGGVMLSKLHDDEVHLRRAIAHLSDWVRIRLAA